MPENVRVKAPLKNVDEIDPLTREDCVCGRNSIMSSDLQISCVVLILDLLFTFIISYNNLFDIVQFFELFISNEDWLSE